VADVEGPGTRGRGGHGFLPTPDRNKTNVANDYNQFNIPPTTEATTLNAMDEDDISDDATVTTRGSGSP
jgi:hypothetical protein